MSSTLGSLNVNFLYPTNKEWTTADTLSTILRMRNEWFERKHYGPFIVCMSSKWISYLAQRYYPDTMPVYPWTLQQRILEIQGVEGIYIRDDEASFTLEVCKRLFVPGR